MDDHSAPSLSGRDFEHYDAMNQQGPCVLCNHPIARDSSFMWVMSFIVITRHLEYTAHVCRTCATRTALADLGKSMLLGWWGIPWGLLTLKALWVNTRTLMRWSRMPAAAGLLIGLLGVAPIAGIVGWIAIDQRQEQQARTTGNWVDEAVIALVEEGHLALDNDDLPAALRAYRRAQLAAPGSSIINLSIARVYYESGASSLALPYVQRAAEIDPEDREITALHALVLLDLDQGETAAQVATPLNGMTPADEYDAMELGRIFSQTESWGEALRVCSWGLERNEELWPLKYCKLEATINLDRSEQYEALATELLDEEEAAGTMFTFLAEVQLMRQDPEAVLPHILEAWARDEYSAAGIKRLLEAAAATGAQESVGRRMREWLYLRDTPEDAWTAARPLFDEHTWPQALDRRLAQENAVVPAVLRAWTYEHVDARAERLRLLRKAKDGEHPWATLAAASYFGDLAPTVTYEEFGRELRRYLTKHPDDPWSRFTMFNHLGIRDAEAALAQLDLLEEGAATHSLPARLAQFGRARLAVDLGDHHRAQQLADALPLNGVPPFLDAEDILYLQTELAILAGNQELAGQLLQLMARVDSPRARSYGMVLGWIEHFGRGTTPSIEQDLAQWRDREDLDQLKHQGSSVIQALLLTAGTVDLAWAHRAAGTWFGETIELISLLHSSVGSGSIDAERLAAISESEMAYAWGPRWARFLLGSKADS